MPYQKIKIKLKRQKHIISIVWMRAKMGEKWKLVKIDTCSLFL